jgi:hypothetical protein
MAATETHATIEDMLEAVFSVQSVPRLSLSLSLYIYKTAAPGKNMGLNTKTDCPTDR